MKRYLDQLLIIFIIVYAQVSLIGQSELPKLKFSNYPEVVEAFDISEDGQILAIGGQTMIQLINTLNSNSIQSFKVEVGLEINAIKISPDNSKIAVLASERFVTIFNVVNHSLIMTTDIGGKIFIAPPDRWDEIGDPEVTSLIGSKINQCSLSSFSERFRFTDNRLLLFSPTTISEFFFDGKESPSIFSHLKADFIHAGYEKVKDDVFPHYSAYLPWFTSYDNVLLRNYKNVVFDPLLKYGFVQFTQNDTTVLEVWNVWTGEKKYSYSGVDIIPKDVDEYSMALTLDGESLFYYHRRETDFNNVEVLGELFEMKFKEDFQSNKIDDIEGMMLFMKGSSDGKHLFLSRTVGQNKLLQDFLLKGKAEGLNEMKSSFWSFNIIDHTLKEVSTGHPSISNVIYSPELQNTFIGADDGFFRVNLNDNIVFPLGKYETSRILNLEVDSSGLLWIGSRNSIRLFDLTSMRQVDYWKIKNAENVSFNVGNGLVYWSDKRNIYELNYIYRSSLKTSPHQNTITSLLYHPTSEKLISGDHIHTEIWSPTCQILTGEFGNQKDKLPFSSSYKYKYEHRDSSHHVEPILSRLSQNNLPVESLALSPDGQFLAADIQDKDGNDRLLAYRMFKQTLSASNDSIRKATLNAMSQLKISVPGEIKLWKFEQNEWKEYKSLQSRFRSFNHEPSALAFSSDSRYLAASDEFLNIHIWNIDTGKKIAECFRKHGDEFSQRELEHLNSRDELHKFRSKYFISSLAFTPDGKFLISGGNDNNLVFWKRVKKFGTESISYIYDGTLVTNSPTAAISKLTFTPDGKYLLIGFSNGKITFFEFEEEMNRGIISISGDSDGFASGGLQNLYRSNPRGRNLVYFKYDGISVPSEQFDLYNNRPDQLSQFYATFFGNEYNKIRRKNNINIDLLLMYKRLNEYGLTFKDTIVLESLPNVEVLNKNEIRNNQTTLSKSVFLDVKAMGDNVPLISINVWVNNVPIFGKNGYSLAELMYTYNKRIEVELSPGRNLIQVACTNKLNQDSPRKSILVYKKSSGLKPNLKLIVIGVDQYNGMNNLNYAVKDGRDLIKKYQDKIISSQYNSITIDSFFNNEIDVNKLEQIKYSLLKTDPADQVVVFYSGHGLQSKEANLYLGMTSTDISNLDNTALPYTTLEWLLDGIPARQKLLLLDACQSGLAETNKAFVIENKQPDVVTKGKPVRKAENYQNRKTEAFFYLKMREMFSDLNRGTGTVTITATTGYGYAQELDSKKNGAFTTCLVNAMSKSNNSDFFNSDLDENGVVNVSELQDFLKVKIKAITEGSQEPMNRTENLGNDFRVW